MIKKKLGLRLVRSNRSYPSLKQDLGKARFSWKEICDRGINSEAVYAAKAQKVLAKRGLFPANRRPAVMKCRCRPCFLQSLSRNSRKIRMKE